MVTSQKRKKRSPRWQVDEPHVVCQCVIFSSVELPLCENVTRIQCPLCHDLVGKHVHTVPSKYYISFFFLHKSKPSWVSGKKNECFPSPFSIYDTLKSYWIWLNSMKTCLPGSCFWLQQDIIQMRENCGSSQSWEWLIGHFAKPDSVFLAIASTVTFPQGRRNLSSPSRLPWRSFSHPSLFWNFIFLPLARLCSLQTPAHQHRRGLLAHWQRDTAGFCFCCAASDTQDAVIVTGTRLR